MSINSKHVAAFLLGAAAALAAKKLIDMTPEEKEKMVAKIKDKAHKLKAEAEEVAGKSKDFFDELRTKGAESLKDHFPDAEEMLSKLFNKSSKTASSSPTGSDDLK